jgi:hypothetical protein
VTAAAQLRLAGYVRSYAAVAPTLAGLVVLALLYGGGIALAGEAYGVSALVLLPVYAWQTKILLDAEPDVQRRLVRVSVGSADREIGAGLLAAAVTTVPTTLLALALPWVFHGVKAGPHGLAVDLATGVWTHLLAAAAGVALGAWASRAAVRTPGIAVCVLAGGSVLTVVFGIAPAPVDLLAPPLITVAQHTARNNLTAAGLAGLTLWGVAWAACVLAAYWRLRRRRD